MQSIRRTQRANLHISRIGLSSYAKWLEIIDARTMILIGGERLAQCLSARSSSGILHSQCGP
jgi:hypothetical protein